MISEEILSRFYKFHGINKRRIWIEKELRTNNNTLEEINGKSTIHANLFREEHSRSVGIVIWFKEDVSIISSTLFSITLYSDLKHYILLKANNHPVFTASKLEDVWTQLRKTSSRLNLKT